MNVIALLLRLAARRTILSIVLGAVSGLLSGAILAVLGRGLAGSHSILAVAGAVALLGAIQVTTSIASRLVFLKALHGPILVDLRKELVDAVLAAPLRARERIGAADLESAFTSGLMQVGFAADALVVMGRSIATALACLALLAYVGSAFLPMVLGAIVAGATLYALFSRFAARAAAREQKLTQETTADALTLLHGNRELRQNAMRRRVFFVEKLEPHVREWQRWRVAASTWNAFAAAWTSVMFFGVIGVLLFAQSTRDADAITSYVLTLLFLQSELAAALHSIDNFRRGSVALGQVEQVRASLHAAGREFDPAQEGAAPEGAAPAWSSLELAGVTTAYDRADGEHTFKLGPIDFKLEPGEVVFLTGGNGSGKTTLAKVICGLYIPDSGEVRANGTAIDAAAREEYRQNFSAIFAEFYLFQRLLGLSAPDRDERAHTYIKEMALAVEVEASRYSTTDLSSGQKKRLAMVTARLEDRPILVFDEWAANQDPDFRDFFYRQLLPQLKRERKAVLVVSHDDRYFAAADRIVRLENGQIVSSQ